MRCLFVLLCGLIAFRSTAQVNDTVKIASDTTMIASDTMFVRKDTITVIGVGDIMMGTNYPENKLPENDGAFLMEGVEPHLRDADITFGNLEGTLLDSGGTAKTCKDPKVCYAFRTPVCLCKESCKRRL